MTGEEELCGSNLVPLQKFIDGNFLISGNWVSSSSSKERKDADGDYFGVSYIAMRNVGDITL